MDGWSLDDIKLYRIRGDDEEWDQVLKKAGNTAVISIKRCPGMQDILLEELLCSVVEITVKCIFSDSDKKRKWEGGNATASNGAPQQGKVKKKDNQHGKFKKNKDKRGKFGKKV
ncbi:unnamed protein product [Menidia menidia]|uniref:(Atlantic silverside) hypothetical protein n=1 Tax=Menidia menidia TaxID=238744 RepID=A0A8S4BA27_9TELE|nr:unnamed protein product [Menidia menidia]